MVYAVGLGLNEKTIPGFSKRPCSAGQLSGNDSMYASNRPLLCKASMMRLHCDASVALGLVRPT